MDAVKVREARTLRAEGLKAAQIAEKLAVPESTVRNWWASGDCPECGTPVLGDGLCSACRKSEPRRLFGIRNFPRDLKAKVIDDAKTRGLNMNEVIVRLLAAHYGVEVDSSANGRPTNPGLDSQQVNLRVPDELDQAIRVAAALNRRVAQEEVVAVVSAAYAA